MNSLRRLSLVGLLAMVVLAACTGAEPSRPSAPVEVTSGDPEDGVAPPIDRTPLLERLQEQEGIYTGFPVPRIEHWRGIGRGAPAYRSAFYLCSRIGLADLAVQLHVIPVNSTVATKVLAAYLRDAWRPSYLGCLDGLVWDARSS